MKNVRIKASKGDYWSPPVAPTLVDIDFDGKVFTLHQLLEFARIGMERTEHRIPPRPSHVENNEQWYPEIDLLAGDE